ncbi:MAG TPA: thiamine pyrophosphate-binding protein, partial [Acidimicrobiales bacterium]|nr:thiamine pyrophosphate-binding protein [Acidimicrobiales bacterium]
MRFGSDLVVDLLAGLGIEYAACNPGATFRGLHDSLVQDPARRVGLIECLHEEDSVAIAHGYAKATGRPMAAVVHDIVGLQHASMAIYNAWCDRVPLLVLGATGPVDAARRRPWIDWIHTANTQATQVRDYTKWDDQPASIEALPESLVRAHHLAMAAPPGPVYVCLDTALQEAPLPDPAPEVPTGVAAPTPLSPHPPAVDRLAGMLLAAEAPVVLADRVGRSTGAVRRLVELADLLALPVIDRELGYNKVSLNFPTHHPLNLSGDLAETLGEAD